MARLTGKRALVLGVSDTRSIAYGIVKAMLAEEIEVICVTHPNPAIFKLAQRALGKLTAYGYDIPLLPCDVAGSDDGLVSVRDTLAERWPEGFDYLVHAVAYSDKAELQGSILNTSRENFPQTMDISAYSLIAACRVLGPALRQHGSVLTLTFAGSQYVAPNYNVMGLAKAALEAAVRYLAAAPELAGKRVTVNAVSAGPVKTMSASAVGGFDLSLTVGGRRSVTGENVTTDEVGVTAVNLMTMPGVTGVILPVDNGIHLSGMGSTPAEMAAHAAFT